MLAVVVNTIELLCTAGLPVSYTRILTARALSSWEYYGYLALYNVAYMADDAAMLGIAVATLGRRKLQEREARWRGAPDRRRIPETPSRRRRLRSRGEAGPPRVAEIGRRTGRTRAASGCRGWHARCMGWARPAVFDDAPFIVFWETTQACDLACKHCRADARPDRDAEELSFEEGTGLLDQIRAMGCPLVVLTGGDPAKRPDLVDLVRHGNRIGLRVALTPSATPLVTRALLADLAEAGLARLAVSLDGASAATHDGFRGVAGSWARTMEILHDARAAGLTTQVNTSVTDWNAGELEEIASQIAALGINLWGVFFLVPTGRGETLKVLEPEAAEEVLERLVAIARTAPFDVKTTAAPHFRRVLLQHQMRRREILGIHDGIGRAPRGVNDGQGIVFVSHRGEIYPSGFLPFPCGSVRTDALADVYRRHPVFTALRDPAALGGKCGVCEFKRVCGGSRARAYAMTGDLFASEPSCAYEPRRLAAAS